jgi:hypothetical protein
MRNRNRWLRSCGRIALAVLVAGACLQAAAGPVLIAEHFSLSLPAVQAFKRADEALRAAGLQIDPPTAISRGGRNDFLTVLIHCIESGDRTLVDLEVAENGRGDEALAMRVFLTEYMKTGRAPAPTGGGLFSGDWDTRCFGGFTYKMRLTQKGDRVTGTYEGNTTGTIEGTVVGRVLRYRWSQSNGNKGAGKFSLEPDGKTFKGGYTYSDDPELSDRYWNGTRVGASPAGANRSGANAAGTNGAGTPVPQFMPAIGPPVKPRGNAPDVPGPSALLTSVEGKKPETSNAADWRTPRLPSAGTDHQGKGQNGSRRPSERNRRVHVLRVKGFAEAREGDRKDQPTILRVEIDLTDSLGPDGMVEVYVGGYALRGGTPPKIEDAYAVKRAFCLDGDADTHYTTRFEMPDVLPCPIRAEITQQNADAVIDSAETRFTHPFPDYGVSRVLLWGDLDASPKFLQMALVGTEKPGDMPVGSKLVVGYLIPVKGNSTLQYAWSGTDETVDVASRAYVGNCGVMSAKVHLVADSYMEGAIASVSLHRADGTIARPLDRRKTEVYPGQPSGGYDSSRLRKIVR